MALKIPFRLELSPVDPGEFDGLAGLCTLLEALTLGCAGEGFGDFPGCGEGARSRKALLDADAPLVGARSGLQGFDELGPTQLGVG